MIMSAPFLAQAPNMLTKMTEVMEIEKQKSQGIVLYQNRYFYF